MIQEKFLENPPQMTKRASMATSSDHSLYRDKDSATFNLTRGQQHIASLLLANQAQDEESKQNLIIQIIEKGSFSREPQMAHGKDLGLQVSKIDLIESPQNKVATVS